MLTLIVLFLLSTLLSTIGIYTIAFRRKADTAYWLKAGLIYGIFALPFVFFAKPRKYYNEH